MEPLGVLIAITPLRLAHGIEHRTANGDGERMQLLPHRRLLPDLAPSETEKGFDALAQMHEAAGDVAFGWGSYRAHIYIIARPSARVVGGRSSVVGGDLQKKLASNANRACADGDGG